MVAPLLVGLVLLLTEETAGAESRTVVAGEHYRAPPLHRLFYGTGYRELWTTPIRVPVLDLGGFAGGLRPLMRVGGRQTPGLALAGADGGSYTFRPVDKSMADLLPDGLSDTLTAVYLQDQTASSHPAAALVVPLLARAAGVLHTEPQLVVMPDDTALGEFREHFAGMLGTIDVYPRGSSEGDPGYEGASQILSSEELWRRLISGPVDRVDSRSFLRARLLDMFLGDWDRHQGQWRWARIPGRPGWQPIPEDRDQAFSHYGGLVLSLARISAPQLIEFEDDYPGMKGLTWQGRYVDRWILTDLERDEWRAIAAEVREGLSDAVIDAAVARLPPEYHVIDGARLAARLKRRRDRLDEMGRRFYLHLSRVVAVRCTDQPEVVFLERFSNGDLEVRVALDRQGDGPVRPYYTRRFRRGETEEVRIHVHAGADRIVTSGAPGAAIEVRVVGDAVVERPASSSIRLEPVKPRPTGSGFGTPLSGHPNEFLETEAERERASADRPEWGRRTVPRLVLVGTPDLGVLLGGGVDVQVGALGKQPYAQRHVVRAGWATSPGRFAFDYRGDFRHGAPRLHTELELRATGIEALNFYGFGNETGAETVQDEREVFRVNNRLVSLSPTLALDTGWNGLGVHGGLELKYSDTENDPERVIGMTRPYGTGGFGQLGLRLGFSLDSRDVRLRSRLDARLRAHGTYYSELWDVESGFGAVEGEAAGYLRALDARLELALRGGGRKLFGTFPWHESAFIGGVDSVRGLRLNRFAGDGSLYGSAELRLVVGRGIFLFPGELGLIGFADSGRVWLRGESSRKWHSSFGGGLFFAVAERSWRFSVTVARSDEMTGVYFGTGLMF